MFFELDALEASGGNGKPMTRAEMQGLALFMGLPPMAQRVHARLGRLERMADRVLAVGEKLDDLQDEGVIDATQAGHFREMCIRARALTKGGAQLTAPAESDVSDGFAYLWGDAFVGSEWDELRIEARAAFTTLRPEGDPWLG
jgi:hypothetical protein